MTKRLSIVPRQGAVMHELVIDRHEYQHILYGRMSMTTKDDHNYRVGDLVSLKSADEEFTLEIFRTITKVKQDGYYVDLGLSR